MMNYIFAFLIIVSIIFGTVTGQLSEVSAAVFDGSKNAITLFITLLGVIPFWSGMMKIAEKSGITEFFRKLLSPFISLIFKGLPKDSKAAQAISMNMVANLLGLGNAATPIGIIAMKELNELKDHRSGVASNHMAMFVTINTASLQLIPTTVAAIRANHGAKNPMDVMTPIWFASVIALVGGIIVCKILEVRSNSNG